MNEKLIAALSDLFIEDSPLYRDVKGLMELAIQETRERCAKIVDERASSEEAAVEIVKQYQNGDPDPMLYALRSLRESARRIREA